MLAVNHHGPVGATLVVARFANPYVCGTPQVHPQPGSLTPMLAVNRQGDHKGRPYGGLFCTPNLNAYGHFGGMVAVNMYRIYCMDVLDLPPPGW